MGFLWCHLSPLQAPPQSSDGLAVQWPWQLTTSVKRNSKSLQKRLEAFRVWFLFCLSLLLAHAGRPWSESLQRSTITHGRSGIRGCSSSCLCIPGRSGSFSGKYGPHQPCPDPDAHHLVGRGQLRCGNDKDRLALGGGMSHAMVSGEAAAQACLFLGCPA